MKRSERIERIADINLGFENIAGAALATSRNEHQKQETQLEQLKIYRDEYRAQLKTRLDDTISPKEIQDYQYFFSSLDNAIEQQQQIVQQSSNNLEAEQQNWLEKKQDYTKMAKVVENLKEKEKIEEQSKEQYESDELSARLLNASHNFSKPH